MVAIETCWWVTARLIGRSVSVAVRLVTVEGLGVSPAPLRLGDLFVQRQSPRLEQLAHGHRFRTCAYWFDRLAS